MRDTPVTFAQVLGALELFGPQARPYNFDDHFDCWGLVRRVFDWLDDGYEIGEELGAAGAAEEACWRRLEDRDALVPGDLLTSHAHTDGDFHTVFYYGRVGDLDLVYDSSSRGLVPLFERAPEGWRWVADRLLYTRYARAPETTDRLRNDGGAYLRLWDDRMRYVNVAFHERLRAGLAAGGGRGAEASGAAVARDLVAQRRAAGFSELPFYCRERLPRDGSGRELYDNLLTRHLDYYVPDGAPLTDDDYEASVAAGGPVAAEPRPGVPRLLAVPPWRTAGPPVEVTWEYDAEGPAADGFRVELWRETHDLWKDRLLRVDFDGPETIFAVPEDLLQPGVRHAVVVYARAGGRYSGDALVPFLYRPAPGDPLLGYNPVRPALLTPDGGAEVPAGVDVMLTWSVPDPVHDSAVAAVAVYEGSGCPALDDEPLWEREFAGREAHGCACVVPAGVLRPGSTCYWYVSVCGREGLPAYAPSEGVFTVAAED